MYGFSAEWRKRLGNKIMMKGVWNIQRFIKLHNIGYEVYKEKWTNPTWLITRIDCRIWHKKEESRKTLSGIEGTICVFSEHVRMSRLNSRKIYPYYYSMQLNFRISVHKIRRFRTILRINPNYFLSRFNQLVFVMGKEDTALGVGIVFLNSVRWLKFWKDCSLSWHTQFYSAFLLQGSKLKSLNSLLEGKSVRVIMSSCSFKFNINHYVRQNY